MDSTAPIVQDEEILGVLTAEANKYLAAAMIADALAAGSGKIKSEKVGDIAVTYDTAIYAALAKSLRRQSRIRSGIPFAGGISVAANQAAEADTDRISPAFGRETHEYPASVQPPGTTGR